MITVTPIRRRAKRELAAAIAEHLGIEVPYESAGSSIDSPFLNAVNHALFGVPTGGADTYRMTERLLSRLGLVYDPRWDTSESRGETGGGTVTTRAFSRVLVAVSGIPRCFLVPAGLGSTPAPVGGDNPPRNNAFVDAGPGSRVLTYHRHGRLTNIVGMAEVVAIEPGWGVPWNAEFRPMLNFKEPVTVRIDGSLHARPIEIDPSTLDTIVGSAHPSEPVLAVGEETAPWSGATAEYILENYPTDLLYVSPLGVPAHDDSDLHPIEELEPEYAPDSEDGLASSGSEDPELRLTNRRAAKLSEERAVALATKALELAGWKLVRDRQKDGVGYDLLFERSGRRVHVEVKGIQGTRLIFNLTPKEWWRAQRDPDWFVVAVTNVLSPTEPKVQAVSRRQVLGGRRRPIGYRLWLDKD